MTTKPTSIRNTLAPRLETDARSIVPIRDGIGGTAVYFDGRLAYYVLNGEWMRALPDPTDSAVPAPPAGTAVASDSASGFSPTP